MCRSRSQKPRYVPADSSLTPRFSGPRTFMRLPLVESLTDVDAAVIGVPTDDAVSFRSGARFGPEAIRSASVLLRPFDPELKIDLAKALSIIDAGDAPTVPGYQIETLERVADHLVPFHEAGVVPLVLGGDHSIALAELRAAAAVHGPLALVHLDAHADTWDSYYGARYFHGTVFRRAVEEGLIDPARSIQAGMRGTLYGAEDEELSRELGFEVLPWSTLRDGDPSEFGRQVLRRVAGRPVFLSFDIDFVDPAFAPGTGTPEVGGPSSAEVLDLLRSLAGLEVVACDCVEVAPSYDAGGVTAWLAASACHLMLCLIALSPGGGARGESGSRSSPAGHLAR
jgi:agmatinase